jgi:hypothetical protein
MVAGGFRCKLAALPEATEANNVVIDDEAKARRSA